MFSPTCFVLVFVSRASICSIQMSFNSVFPHVCLPSHKHNEICSSLVQVGIFCFRKGFLSAKLGRNSCTLVSCKMVPSGKSYSQSLKPWGSDVSLDLMRPSLRSCFVYIYIKKIFLLRQCKIFLPYLTEWWSDTNKILYSRIVQHWHSECEWMTCFLFNF